MFTRPEVISNPVADLHVPDAARLQDSKHGNFVLVIELLSWPTPFCVACVHMRGLKLLHVTLQLPK